MKKMLLFIAVFLGAAAILFANGAKENEATNFVIGAVSEPHISMLKVVAPELAEHGIMLEIVEINDFNKLNMAVENGQLDANFFQHIPFMEAYNEENGTHLVCAGRTHIEPIALYSNKISSIRELRNGATIVIPEDPTNTRRALLLLQKANLIQFEPAEDGKASIKDITFNPRNLKIHAIESGELTSALADVDAAIISGNYALMAGLSAAKDGLLVEEKDTPYVNAVVVKEGSQNDPRVIALVKALQGKKIKAFIIEHYPAGEVIPTF